MVQPSLILCQGHFLTIPTKEHGHFQPRTCMPLSPFLEPLGLLAPVVNHLRSSCTWRVSWVFGFSVLWLGQCQMLFGRVRPWIPEPLLFRPKTC